MTRRIWKKMENLFVANTNDKTMSPILMTNDETDAASDDEEYSADPRVYCHFLNMRPEELADQLTLMDFAVFKEITREEQRKCIRKEWSEVPNIRTLVARSVSLRTWVVDVLLATPSMELRTTVLQLFVRMARRLHKLGNIQSCKALMQGLTSEPVTRLRSSWKEVSSETKKHYKKYCKLYLNDAKIGEKMWEKWTAKMVKCIPPVDLFFRVLEREDKINLIADFVESMQTSDYGYIWPENCCVQHYLSSIRYTVGQRYYLEENGVKISSKLESKQ